MNILAAVVISTTFVIPAPTPIIVEGWASQYARDVMQQVVSVRQSGRTRCDLPRDLPLVHGYIAVLDCERIGEVWSLRPTGTNHWERFLVADCSGHAETTDWIIRNNILVEVDHETAVRWHTVGRGIRVEISDDDVSDDSRKRGYMNGMIEGRMQ